MVGTICLVIKEFFENSGNVAWSLEAGYQPRIQTGKQMAAEEAVAMLLMEMATPILNSVLIFSF